MRRIVAPCIRFYIPFLAHLSLLPLVQAFTPTFTASTGQCAEFTVSWAVNTNISRAGPPFNLLLIPVNPRSSPFPNSAGLTGANLSLPFQVAIPDSAWNAASNTGTYTISALPLRTGERFIVVMDDGFGLGTGGVSEIQTVGFLAGGQPTDCLGPILSESDVVLVPSTFTPAQCQPLSIITGQASAIRGFVPGGTPFSLDLPASGTGNMTTTWSVNVRTGSSFVLVYIGRDGKLGSTGMMQSGSDNGNGDACVVNGPRTTMGEPGPTSALPPGSTQTPSTSSSGTSSLNTPALVGGIIGSLSFLAIAALIIFFCIYRRTDGMGRPKSRSTGSGGGGRSTLEPYKSYDLGGSSGVADEAALVAGSGRAGAGGGGNGNGSVRRNVTSRSPASPSNAVAAGLEARFGSGLFGRRKKGPNGRGDGGGGGGGGGDSRSGGGLTDSRRKIVYPGLSIASTQNRSVGVVSAGAGAASEDGYLHGSRDTPATAGASPAVGGVLTAYREAKRREARMENEHVRRGSDPSSFVSGNGTTSSVPLTEEERYAGAPGRRGGDLSAINEVTAYGSGTYATDSMAQRQRRHSFEDSDAYHDGSMALADLSTNEKSATSGPTSSSELPLGASAASRNSERRPSTAPHTGAAAPYHLPTSLARSPVGGNVENQSLRMHEYPPDNKTPSPTEWESERSNWRAGGGGGAPVSAHPYATAQSPHSDAYSSPFLSGTAMTTTTGSISSRGRRGGGGSGRGRHPYADPLGSPTEIIRHRDAGPMMSASDDEDEEGGGRRVVELPPSYGEVTSSNRGRRRGAGGGQ